MIIGTSFAWGLFHGEIPEIELRGIPHGKIEVFTNIDSLVEVHVTSDDGTRIYNPDCVRLEEIGKDKWICNLENMVGRNVKVMRRNPRQWVAVVSKRANLTVHFYEFGKEDNGLNPDEFELVHVREVL